MKSPRVLASVVSLAALIVSASCTPTSNVPAVTGSAPSTTSSPVGHDDAAIEEAERAYIDMVVATSPESATGLGLHARDTELDDYSLAGNAAVIAKQKAMLDSLRSRFAKTDASPSKKVDLELIEHALSVSIRQDAEVRPLERLPMNYVRVLDTLFNMVARTYAPAPERAA